MAIPSTSLAARLRHSWPAQRLKLAARDLWWTLKRPTVRNPPLVAPVRSMVFVCLGNICRSPYAEVAAPRILRAAGLGEVRCESAGLRAKPGTSPPAEAMAVSAARGASLANHQPRLTTNELLADYDLIVVMEARQLTQLRAEFPAHAARVVLLPLFSPGFGYRKLNIADPYGRSREVFQDCFAAIDRGLEGLARTLAEAGAAGRNENP